MSKVRIGPRCASPCGGLLLAAAVPANAEALAIGPIPSHQQRHCPSSVLADGGTAAVAHYIS